jgi:ATP-dependent DNA ligase
VAQSTNWLKAKCYAVGEVELLGVEREAGKPAFALMGEIGTRKYVGSAFINSSREIRERLWKRVQEHAGPAPKGIEAAGDAMGKAGADRPCEASARRGGPTARLAAGFSRGAGISV